MNLTLLLDVASLIHLQTQNVLSFPRQNLTSVATMQSIEDFEKEHAAQYEQNVQRVAQTAKPKKQKKPDVSAIDFQLETDALNEIGTENWVGKLLG